MKARRVVIPTVSLLICLLFSVGLLAALRNPSMSGVALEFQDTISAGDAWSLHIQIPDAEVGEPVDVYLYHGLRRLSARLTLGSGGVAAWDVAAGQLTQSGNGLIVVRYQEIEVRASLTILPSLPTEADFFVTVNTIAAYGDETTTLLALSRDAWGNSVAARGLSARIRYPDGSAKTLPMRSINGIAWAELASAGVPGRIRITLNQIQPAPTLEVQQVASAPDSITFQVTPECVLADGREVLTLTAQVRDRYGVPVVDGTLVRFEWDAGTGTAITADGMARLRLPSPQARGEHLYWALSGAARSAQARVVVSNEGCG